MHVVERVETYDWVSRNRFVTRYTYHHGFYDGVEREFRGFGRVEQLDTEEFARPDRERRLSGGDNIDAASNVPPVLTRTWFHTGSISKAAASRGIWRTSITGKGSTASRRGRAHPTRRSGRCCSTTRSCPSDLTPEEAREACRRSKDRCCGRRSTRSTDTEKSSRPYIGHRKQFHDPPLQRRGPNRHAVFFTHAARAGRASTTSASSTISTAASRADPRVSHGVTLEVDDYGNVLKSAADRLWPPVPGSLWPLRRDQDRKKQARILLDPDRERLHECGRGARCVAHAAAAEQRLFELLKVRPEADLLGITNLFRFRELATRSAQAGDGAHDLPFAGLAGDRRRATTHPTGVC